MDFTALLQKRVRVRLVGGREVVGRLRGYDLAMNLTLDEAVEAFRGASRTLGVVVCRGPTVLAICPEDSFEEIANPFLETEETVLEGSAGETTA